MKYHMFSLILNRQISDSQDQTVSSFLFFTLTIFYYCFFFLLLATNSKILLAQKRTIKMSNGYREGTGLEEEMLNVKQFLKILDKQLTLESCKEIINCIFFLQICEQLFSIFSMLCTPFKASGHF